ncbi:MAG: hypothetical protein HYY13_06555 [Nitrospirae bacterium]|nr:hypothetical protein [Nitrospirota bacterium]
MTTATRQPGQKKVYVEFEDKSDNEEGFVLERKTAEATFVPVGRAPSNVRCELTNPSRKVPCFVDEDRGLHNGVVYTYRAWAYRGGLASNYSSEVRLTFE